MRPFADLRPPGIYPTMAEPSAEPLAIADTSIVGFVGLAQKGPINVPTRIGNWEEFVEIYGFTANHYLTASVEAFFRNGGTDCYIVRVAHLSEEGSADDAAVAAHVVNDGWNKPTLRVTALNEGEWGNGIWIRFVQNTGASALLTRDLEVGSGEAEVTSTRGFEVGQLVKIRSREDVDYIVLTDVGDKVLRWGSETPVNRRHRAAAPTRMEVVEFELHTVLRDRREVFKHLQLHPSSRRYAPRVVAAESRLVCLEDLRTSSPPPHNMPQAEPLTKLRNGRDGTDVLTPEDFVGFDRGPGERGGLLSLVAVDQTALLVCPDAMTFLDRDPGPLGEMRTQRVQDAMVDMCENMKDRFAILDCPQTRNIEEVKAWRRRTDSSYAAYYWPWIVIPSADGKTRSIPPSGVMSGIFAVRDKENGVHHPPANLPIVGAVDLSVRVTEDHLGALNAEAVNSFRISRGIRPWGVRTASSDPDWRYINVRRIFIMLRRSLDVGMAWVPFESNDKGTWDNITSKTKAFLATLFQKGMFAGGNPEESFYVKCDAETNPPLAVDNGRLVCQIGVAPVIPAEYIMIQVVQDMGGDTE